MSFPTIDTAVFFSGGAGMFIQYHDVAKPIYLYAAMKMLYTGTTYGLPFQVLGEMTPFALLEWYCNRLHINPLKSLDLNKQVPDTQLDSIMNSVLQKDPSIYKLAPPLNVQLLLSACITQKLSFPVYLYSPIYDEFIQEDAKTIFPGMPVHYLHGPLSDVLKNCDQNFTYILSDIELLVELCRLLKGSCSHVLLTRDYLYNYKNYYKTLKYDLKEIMDTHEYLRIGTTLAMDKRRLVNAMIKIIKGGSE